MIRWLFILLLLSGCLSVGDGAARLRGELVLPTSDPSCWLQLLGDDVESDPRAVQTLQFEETFVLPPGLRSYVVEVRCDSVPGVWRSDEIELGRIESYRRGVDLGVIVIDADLD